METITKSIEILGDLIQINNDRIEGYENALKELKSEDHDLKTVFIAMIDESRKMKLDLANELQVEGGDADQGTTALGKIYRVWTDVKAVFTGHDRHSILSNCEYGEDAAQKAYTAALKSEGLPEFIRETLTKQQFTLKMSHDKVKSLRDDHSSL